jgi:hypothetical protein
MQSSKTERAINDFRLVYETNVSKGIRQYRVSQLTEKEQKDYWARDATLHPSSMPFCGLRSAYERLLREPDPIVERDFGFDYFLPVGHATHYALQKWLGHSGQLIGNWKCAGEGCKRKWKFRSQPKKCDKCGHREFHYDELGGVSGKNFHWHTDGVFHKKDGQYWVIDYKTTSEFAIKKHNDAGKTVFPYMSNRFQIETYVPLVEEKYNIKIAGWLLVYVPRDGPKLSWKIAIVGGQINEERRERLKQRLEVADRDFSVSLKVKEHPVKVFKKLEQSKICEDREFYDNFIHDQYNECPLHKQCFAAKKLKKKLATAIETAAAYEE